MRKHIQLCGLCLALSACTAAGPVQEDHFYTLSADYAAAPAAAERASTVYVAPLQASGVYADRAIVYREAGAPLVQKRYHYHHWSDRPATLLRQGLADCLRGNGLIAVAERVDQERTADIIVEGRIVELDKYLRSSPERVRIQIELGARTNNRDEKNIFRVYSADVTQQGDGMQATAAAFSAAFQKICTAFVRDLGAVAAK